MLSSSNTSLRFEENNLSTFIFIIWYCSTVCRAMLATHNTMQRSIYSINKTLTVLKVKKKNDNKLNNIASPFRFKVTIRKFSCLSHLFNMQIQRFGETAIG